MARWFRSHASKLNKPKVLRLSDKLYRAWDSLLCIACEFDGVLPSLADTALLLRKSEKEARALLDELVSREFFIVTDRGIEPHKWNEWQYKSDVSTERVKRFRERQGAVSETPSESETDSEADTEQTKAKALESAGAQKPKRKTTLPKDWKATEEQLAYASEQGCSNPPDTAERFRLHHLSKGTLGADWNLGFQYWCRNEKKFNGGGGESASDKRAREVDEAIKRSALQ